MPLPLPAEPNTSVAWLDLDATPLAVLRHGAVTMADLAGLFDTGFQALGAAIAAGELTPTGPAVAIYRGDPATTFDLEIGFPVAQAIAAPIAVDGAVVVGSQLPAGPAATLSHLGAYDGLPTAWEKLMTAVQAGGATLRDGTMVEVYVTQPSPEADPATMRTDLIVPTDRADATT
ncbi:GyrI-like domain-containing protein [Rhodococcus sp. NPDC059234]|uniref:GyrI-like domain-containing protein n=1 Tax=Rhodococcus sp. NPDC059234 TaxID=3346781 RepID=UPI0036722C53